MPGCTGNNLKPLKNLKNNRSKNSIDVIPYSQTIAEQSKDAILENVRKSTDKLETTLNEGFYTAIITIAVHLVLVMILLFIFVVIMLYYGGIITLGRAAIALVFWLIFVIIMVIIFIVYTTRYARRRIHATGDVYKNFVASEKVLTIIDGASAVYVKTARA